VLIRALLSALQILTGLGQVKSELAVMWLSVRTKLKLAGFCTALLAKVEGEMQAVRGLEGVVGFFWRPVTTFVRARREVWMCFSSTVSDVGWMVGVQLG
jgi:hypothetical protein